MTLVIAEIGHNHQNLKLALKMIAAAASGVNAVKLQKNNKILYTKIL